MNASRRNERLRWLLVLLIGMLVSFFISEWKEASLSENNMTHVNPKTSTSSPEHVISKCFPIPPDRPQEFLKSWESL
ncbi:hypothetical protein Echvi_1752 [Echinicola vietnamensis DSM 17526]|uniref:Uncharacterized protein n=1 Tax=Echinicola vietnamensis (strain DSM 17526 / LMG 23754 / KMM 6221) TaxID=926556 RepID=L0FXL4_ECHVK|nr:hypothetical protein Echvi_1752 [Echinicola vietnamensis DSM 17526]